MGQVCLKCLWERILQKRGRIDTIDLNVLQYGKYDFLELDIGDTDFLKFLCF